MSTALVDLDHVMIRTRGHAEAAAQFDRLGFRRRGVRGNVPMGGASAGGRGGSDVVVLRSRNPRAANYLELAYADPATASEPIRTILAGEEGLALLVHASDDVDTLRDRWSAAGMQTTLVTTRVPPVGASPGQLLRILLPSADGAPVLVNAVQYETVAEYRDAELLQHPNGATSWTSVTCAVDAAHFERAVATFARLYLQEPLRAFPLEARFEPGTVRLKLVTRERFDALYGAECDSPHPVTAAVTIGVADRARLVDALQAGDVPWRATDGCVAVPSSFACGVVLRFEPEHG